MRRLYSGDLAECFRLHRAYALLAIDYGLDLPKCFPHRPEAAYEFLSTEDAQRMPTRIKLA